ncbi:YggS family pyridoxal phosphate-dependent enzyme [Roseivirga sp. E12]|uniref:YggS family pyridoxal phosphate-dependent enzyme n=1 Tax=Roseivirga sp. E12 TaxID=2819237 RepID=UPI001ABC2D93|nr:YggS family pyridoxal phosphate-dependent enzyme [Roseivirga sp. E12]MBO3700841.1 YggS family pyridoxal phosphate-dependent enzyme [Roseivirga sp. E12]
MSIVNNINHYNEQLAPYNTRLIAVSKTKPVEDLLQAYEGGQRDFGENKVQELSAKEEVLPKDIKWHMIGHLQRNKVKYIAPFVHLIHAVDSPKLLAEINKQALKNDRVIACLLQVHIAEEETKFGFDETELMDFLNGDSLKEYNNVKILGLMGMATNTSDKAQVSKEFDQLKSLFNQIKSNFDLENVDMQELSMGMTSDYIEACQAGSTMVRIGSAIFGARNYPQQ